MKTRKQIIEKFLADKKAKALNTVITENKSAEDATDKETVKSFYEALAERDTQALKALQENIVKGYEKALGDGQNVSTPADGGYLVPVELSKQINEKLTFLSPIRSLATVISNLPPVLELPFEDALPQTYWVDEGKAATQSKSTFSKKEIKPYKLAGFGKFSYESLNDTASNPSLQAFVADRFALSIAMKENDAFVNGDGDKKPTGFRHSTFTGVNTHNVVKAKGLTYGDLVKALYGVHPASRANGVWVMPTEAIKQIVSMVDGNNRPLYVPAVSEGAPATILGRPVYEVPEIPTNLGSGTDQTEIWFGDFKNYIIGDREAMRVEFGTTGTDLESDMISLVLFKRVAGLPTYAESFYKIAEVPAK